MEQQDYQPKNIFLHDKDGRWSFDRMNDTDIEYVRKDTCKQWIDGAPTKASIKALVLLDVHKKGKKYYLLGYINYMEDVDEVHYTGIQYADDRGLNDILKGEEILRHIVLRYPQWYDKD